MDCVQEKKINPTSRFSNRAENYMQFRPAYPVTIAAFIEAMAGMKKDQLVADIGTGTGLFASLFLQKGYQVNCIEPNADMRAVAEMKLNRYAGYRMLPNRAELTGLDSRSVDLITVGHAFHWMDPLATRKEFRRILKPAGHIVLARTFRKLHTPILAGFDTLKRHFSLEPYPDIQQEEIIGDFFQPATTAVKSFPHDNWLNFDGLKGLLLSSSGIPLPGHSSYDTMISSLIQLFVAENINGFVQMEYETKIYYAV